ncbi:hypothetical protein Ae201684P_016088 [Aphanomyces euteiches]|nr:hypothetical protein Ae201684P_016088 [Aphanomyces euteiches]
MSHTGVSVPEVIARGGWSFDSLNRAFLYFSAMDRGDMRVGRVLAGWADSDHGGVPVMFDAIPTNEQPMFQSLTRHLFRHVLAKYDEHLLLALSSSLISYYNIVESEWVKRDSSASCFNHDVVRRSLNTVGGNDFILSKWSSILRESWLISNLLWLGHDQISGLTTDIKDKATVSALTLEKKLDLLAAGQHESAKQLARLVNIVAEQQAQVVALTHTVKQLSDATSALEKTLTVFAHTRSNEPTNAYQSIQPKAPVINSGVVSVPFSTAHVVPIPKSLKNMRASFVFLEFYSNRWYALPLSPNEKEIMRKIRLVVGRVKDFLPADCILTLPPRPDDKKFGKWQTDLDRHARLAEKSMLQYISQIKPHITKRERAFLFANSVNKDLAQATSRDDYPKRVHTDNTSVDV